MTGKERIIIHDVDVSKCEFYDKDKGYCLTLKMNPKGFKNSSCFSGDFQECIQENKICPNIFCHSNSNCYYKQLARKTAECEKHEQALDEIEEYIYTDCEYNDGCDRNICIRCKYSNVHDKRILAIISKVKDSNNAN